MEILSTPITKRVISELQSKEIDPDNTRKLLLSPKIYITKHKSTVAIDRLAPIYPLRM